MSTARPPAVLPSRTIATARTSGRRLFIAGWIVLALGLVALALSIRETYFVLELTELSVPLEGLPPGADGFRLLHLSDLHLDWLGVRERHLIDRLRSVDADLAVITGDLVNGYLRNVTAAARREQLDSIVALLTEIVQACRCPVYFVRGNHDDDDELPQLIETSGVHVLINDCARIPVPGGTLALVGIDHFALADEASLCRPGTFRVEEVLGSHALLNDEEYLNTYVHYVVPGAERLTNYRVTADLWFEHRNGGVGLVAYSQLPFGDDRFYRLRRYPSHRPWQDRFFHLAPHDAYCEQEQVAVIPVTLAAGRFHSVTLEVRTLADGAHVRGYLTNDASAPVAEAVDLLQPIGSGTFGFWCYASYRKAIDNIRVESLPDGALIYAQDFASTPIGARPPELVEGPSLTRATRALSRLPKGAFPIALVHAPRQAPEIARLGVPLILAGDTHGGQIRLPFLAEYVVPDPENRPYLAGLYQIGSSTLYVSRGTGTSVIPLRFRSPPEITLITLRRKT